ncbi:MAG: hypothetical protein A2Y06_01785 [Omnitrophica WOR_2 bacterium GWA2_37_7]|nr:MAG: hypothetical protein A2Y06_01785 [Omnitrophica WOR_2 bacterium GWA2_37_7]
MLTAGLDKSNFESLLVCGAISSTEGDMAYYASQKEVRPLYIPQLKRELNPLNDLIAFIKILWVIKKENPDILHTHTAKAGSLGRLAGIAYNFFCLRQRKIKLIHTFHGHIFDGYFNKFFTTLFILAEKGLAYFTNKIITVSEEIKRELISLGIAKADKILVIPLGFELEKFLEIVPRDQKEIVNIGIVGRLVPVKNHWLFLKAAQMLRLSLANEAKPYKVKFKIVGDGELKQKLEESSLKLNIADCVEFVGWQKDLVKVYSELDIVCLTSLNEGTPVSLIEAMASAKAVIATDVGGVRDLLGQDRGIAVESNNAEAFSAALFSLLSNVTARERLGKKAREFVREKFTKQRLLRGIEELYLNI